MDTDVTINGPHHKQFTIQVKGEENSWSKILHCIGHSFWKSEIYSANLPTMFIANRFFDKVIIDDILRGKDLEYMLIYHDKEGEKIMRVSSPNDRKKGSCFCCNDTGKYEGLLNMVTACPNPNCNR